MIKLEFGVENAQEVAASLALVENLPVYLNPLIREWAGRTTSTHLYGMKNYAPPRGDYRRTGQLGNSWGYRELSPGQFSFENKADYAGYVVGDEEQAWMHRGRWWQAAERIDEQVIALALLLDEALSKWPAK